MTYKSTLKSIYEISDSIKSICGIDGSNGIYTKLGEDLIKKLANVELKKNGVVLSSIDLKNCLINTLEEHIIRVLIKELVLAIEQLLLEDQPFQDLLKEQCELATKQLSNAVKNIVSDASQKELTKELIDKLRPRLFEEIECIDFSKRELLGKIYENLSEKLTQKIQSNLKESVEQKLEERNPIDSILEYSIKKVKVKIKNIIKKCKKKNCKKYDSCKGRQYYNSAI